MLYILTALTDDLGAGLSPPVSVRMIGFPSVSSKNFLFVGIWRGALEWLLLYFVVVVVVVPPAAAAANCS